MSLKDTDVKTLGDAAIAKKFKLSLARVRKLVDVGAKHEKEHNTNLAKAREVARDHIGERPDYYKMLKKAEKTPVSMKEESATGAVRGLGFVTGDPGINPVTQYINTNAMAYVDANGNKLEYLKKRHIDLHNSKLGYTAFDPTRIGANKNFIKEAKLNELGEYDNKGGTPGYEETTGLNRAVRKRDVKEQSPANVSYKERPMYEKSTGNMPAAMSAASDRGIYQEASTEKLQGYTTAAAERLASGSDAGDRQKEVNRITGINTAVRKLHPDLYPGEVKVPVKEHRTPFKHTTEETKMDNKEYINEALDCILEDNLSEMKDNLMKALQEKAIEKLEERKKEIAANYFAE